MTRFILFFFQFLLEVGMIIFYPFSGIIFHFMNKRVKEVTSDTQKTILLVQRWLNRNIFHLYWMRYLRNKGFSVHFLFLPLSKHSFEQSSREIKRYIEKHDLHDVTLVGISSGGISSLLYLQKLDGWRNVSQFISAGTPFKGTYTAIPLLFRKPIKQLLPWNPLFAEIETFDIQHKERITCIAATADELVPQKSSLLPGVKHIIISVIGHNNLHLYSRKLYDEIARIAEKEDKR